MPSEPTATRAGIAGVAAAAAWLATEPLARRVFGTNGYSVARLLGRPLSTTHWRAAGILFHLANGALAGLLFRRGRLGGWKAGVVALQLENVLAWPTVAVAERLHPDHGKPDWPPLFGNARVFGHEAAGHAVFGLVLGVLLQHRPKILNRL